MADEGPKKLRAVGAGSARENAAARLKQSSNKMWSLLSGSRHFMGVSLPALVGLTAALVLGAGDDRFAGGAALVGLAVLTGLTLHIVYYMWLRPGLEQRPRRGEMLFLACLLVALAATARGFYLLSTAMSLSHGMAASSIMGFAVPLAVGPMLAALFMGLHAGLLVALCAAMMAGIIWPNQAGMFIFYLLSGTVACFWVARTSSRLSMLRASLYSAVTGLLTVAALALFQGWLISPSLAACAAAVVIGCGLSGLLAAGLAPLIEAAFGFISDIKLMELASLDHPVLQELMLQAPGTYHHSLVVGSMVEAAARDIGANHRLAKVAALYHDLGKVKKAAYFIENQMGGPNRHEKLAPSMSALILTSHVKEGVEMARAHGLGRPIMDIIGQHHGTRLIHYFYSKAREQRLEAGQPEPDPQAFRYPGPRPQTREAGLVMLADTVEAAARSLDSASPSRLQGLVQSQINKVFAEGQLDECELTLKDLHKIAKVFTRILNGIFHQRVEYPGGDEKSKKRDDNSDRQSPRQGGNRPAEPGDADQTDLKRLGLG